MFSLQIFMKKNLNCRVRHTPLLLCLSAWGMCSGFQYFSVAYECLVNFSSFWMYEYTLRSSSLFHFFNSVFHPGLERLV